MAGKKVFHLVIESEDRAQDFIDALDGFECRTTSTATDDMITALIEEIKEVFEL